MPLDNAAIARRLAELADLLEVADENPFRVRAYREASSTVRGNPEPMHELLARGEDISELHGIGKATAAKIAELLETGRLTALEEQVEAVGDGIARLLAVPGLGPKRLRTLRTELGTGERETIERAARDGRIRAIAGFGAGLEQKILEAVSAGDARDGGS